MEELKDKIRTLVMAQNEYICYLTSGCHDRPRDLGAISIVLDVASEHLMNEFEEMIKLKED